MNTFQPRIPISGRGATEILGFHGLPASSLEGKSIYDLGCGLSDLGADLAAMGITASVTGFDKNPECQEFRELREGSGEIVICELDDIKAPDESADIVIATYSLPLWGRSAAEITAFFEQCKRLVRLEGLVSIYPIAVSTQTINDSFEGEIEREDRWLAASLGVADFTSSANWLPMQTSRHNLIARKIS